MSEKGWPTVPPPTKMKSEVHLPNMSWNDCEKKIRELEMDRDGWKRAYEIHILQCDSLEAKNIRAIWTEESSHGNAEPTKSARPTSSEAPS